MHSLRSTNVTSIEQMTYKLSEVWRAPELKAGGMSEEADVFSYGIIIIQIATRYQLPQDKVDFILVLAVYRLGLQ